MTKPKRALKQNWKVQFDRLTIAHLTGRAVAIEGDAQLILHRASQAFTNKDDEMAQALRELSDQFRLEAVELRKDLEERRKKFKISYGEEAPK